MWYFVIELFSISSALAVALKHIERRGIIKKLKLTFDNFEMNWLRPYKQSIANQYNHVH